MPAQDQNREERHREVPRWAIRAIRFVGMAARRAPRRAIVTATGLVGMAAFWHRGVEALEQNPTADSTTQQNSMGVGAAAVPDPVDQSEANSDSTDEIAPPAASPGAPLDPNLLDEATPGPTLHPNLTDPNETGPTLDAGLAGRFQQNPDAAVAAWQQDPSTIGQIQHDPGVIHDLAGATPPVGAEGQQVTPPVDQQPPVGNEGLPSIGGEDQVPPTDQAPPVDQPSPLGAEDLAANNPDLFDPNAPGPILDPAVLDPTKPGPTVDPSLLDPSAPGPILDPSQLEAGLTEPSGVTNPGGQADPSLTEPVHPEPAITAGHDVDDHHLGT